MLHNLYLLISKSHEVQLSSVDCCYKNTSVPVEQEDTEMELRVETLVKGNGMGKEARQIVMMI